MSGNAQQMARLWEERSSQPPGLKPVIIAYIMIANDACQFNPGSNMHFYGGIHHFLGGTHQPFINR